MNAPSPDHVFAAPLGEIRLAVSTLRHLARVGQLDHTSLLTALALIDEHIDELEVLAPAVETAQADVVRIPIMTLAEVAAQARRPALSVIDGGLS